MCVETFGTIFTVLKQTVTVVKTHSQSHIQSFYCPVLKYERPYQSCSCLCMSVCSHMYILYVNIQDKLLRY